jgi:uncharacterized membrane protein YkvA (DUF1232 family)
MATRTPKATPRQRCGPAPTGGRDLLLKTSDIRTILDESARRIAPADIATLLDGAAELRQRAAELRCGELPLLGEQLDFALECLHDHLEGSCPQIPLYTISLLGAGVMYFCDQVDVIPDFLPHIGKLDDAAVMAMAFRLARDGVERYAAWKGREVAALIPSVGRRRR